MINSVVFIDRKQRHKDMQLHKSPVGKRKKKCFGFYVRILVSEIKDCYV